MTTERTDTENKSLAKMMASLRLLENEIDESDEITLEQCQEHFDAIKEIDSKVDRLLGYMDVCKRNAALFAERAKEIDLEATRWEKRLASLEKYALFLCSAFPDIEWRGSERVISKGLNQPSLKQSITNRFSTENCLPEEFLADVPKEYREAKTIWVLKTKELKDDLKKGKEVGFARLERKEKLVTKFKQIEGK